MPTLFADGAGKPLDSDHAKYPWQTAAKCAGLRDIGLHGMRYSFALQLVAAGVDIYRVQRLLGHGSTAMTQRYAHLARGDFTGCTDVLSGAISVTKPATLGRGLVENPLASSSMMVGAVGFTVRPGGAGLPAGHEPRALVARGSPQATTARALRILPPRNRHASASLRHVDWHWGYWNRFELWPSPPTRRRGGSSKGSTTRLWLRVWG